MVLLMQSGSMEMLWLTPTGTCYLLFAQFCMYNDLFKGTKWKLRLQVHQMLLEGSELSSFIFFIKMLSVHCKERRAALQIGWQASWQKENHGENLINLVATYSAIKIPIEMIPSFQNLFYLQEEDIIDFCPLCPPLYYIVLYYSIRMEEQRQEACRQIVGLTGVMLYWCWFISLCLSVCIYTTTCLWFICWSSEDHNVTNVQLFKQ